MSDTQIQPTALLAMCSQCGDGTKLPLPVDQRSLSLHLAQRGWFVSVLAPPNQNPEVTVLLGALCAACAQTVYPPEIYKVAEERRQQLLQVAATGAAQ